MSEPTIDEINHNRCQMLAMGTGLKPCKEHDDPICPLCVARYVMTHGGKIPPAEFYEKPVVKEKFTTETHGASLSEMSSGSVGAIRGVLQT